MQAACNVNWYLYNTTKSLYMYMTLCTDNVTESMLQKSQQGSRFTVILIVFEYHAALRKKTLSHYYVKHSQCIVADSYYIF